MKITEVSVKNFRLLKDVKLTFDPKTTIIVGRNNSGKTSLTEILRRFLSDNKPVFNLEDFSLETVERFNTVKQMVLSVPGRIVTLSTKTGILGI